MSSPSPELNVLNTLNADEAVTYVVHWLQNSSIAQYFESHPNARDAIVAAVQKLLQPKALLVPALTPCYTDLTNKQPLPFRSQSAQTTHQEVEADDSEVEHTLSGSQRSADLDCWSPFDEIVETHTQDTSEDDKPLVQAISSSISHQANDTCPIPNGTKQIQIGDEDEIEIEMDSTSPRSSARPELEPAEERQRKSPKLSDALHNKEYDRFRILSVELRAKIQRIAGAEARAWAWHFLNGKRNPPPSYAKGNQDTTEQLGTLDVATASDYRLRELKNYVVIDEEREKSIQISKRMAAVSQRLHLAELIGRYIEERDRPKAIGRKRKKIQSAKDRFVDLLFPETINYKGSSTYAVKRKKAKQTFDNWVKKGEPWARMTQRCGDGILVLTPDELTNEELRILSKPHLEVFLDYIDCCRPDLKCQLSNLSAILPGLVDYGILPSRRLVIEVVPTSQWLDIGNRSLGELFQYCAEDADLQGFDTTGTGSYDAICSSEQAVCWGSGFGLALGAVLDSGQLPSPTAGMNSRAPCPTIDMSGSICSSESLWAGDCELAVNPGAVAAENNLTTNMKIEECPLPPASRLDNHFLLSPLVISEGMILP